jgi:hypothetical protein
MLVYKTIIGTPADIRSIGTHENIKVILPKHGTL